MKFNKELINKQLILQTKHKFNSMQKILLLNLVQLATLFVSIKWKSMELLKNHLLIPLILRIKHKYILVRNLTRLYQKYRVGKLTFRLIAMFIGQINLVKANKKGFNLKRRKTTRKKRIRYHLPRFLTTKNFKNPYNNRIKRMKPKINLKTIYH